MRWFVVQDAESQNWPQNCAKYVRPNGRRMGFFAVWGLHFVRGCGIFLLFDDDFMESGLSKVRFLFMIGRFFMAKGLSLIHI